MVASSPRPATPAPDWRGAAHSGVLVLLTIYKVISSRESVLAESRKEEQRGIMERKARLAVMRRSLAGPLRSAARDLNVRLQEILLPTPPTGHARHNYFASHYLEDPEESINTTLYRLCRYLFWVEQLQRGIHSDGELAMDDAWQVVGQVGTPAETTDVVYNFVLDRGHVLEETAL